MKQTNFFDKVTVDGLAVVVSREGDEYRADILGGWWTAVGKTRDAAVRAVVGKYEAEIEKES